MKYKCIRSYYSGEWLTKDNIYEYIDGKFTFDDGYTSRTFSMDNSSLGSHNMSYYLEEIKEDKNMKREFKVGDNVRIIGNSNNHSYEIGDVIKLRKEYRGSNTYYIKGGMAFTAEGGGGSVIRTIDMEHIEQHLYMDIRGEKIAVLCDTKEKAFKFYELVGSDKTTFLDCCNPSELYCIITLDGTPTWDSLGTYESYGYKLISFEEFIGKPTSKTLTITTSDTTTTLTDGTHTTTVNRYHTDKHNERNAVSSVIDKYYDELKQIEIEKNMPKVGDMVRVVDKGEVYTMNNLWLEENNVPLKTAIKWRYKNSDIKDSAYKVVCIHKHNLVEFEDRMLALIEDGGDAFIMNIEGLEVVR